MYKMLRWTPRNVLHSLCHAFSQSRQADACHIEHSQTTFLTHLKLLLCDTASQVSNSYLFRRVQSHGDQFRDSRTQRNGKFACVLTSFACTEPCSRDGGRMTSASRGFHACRASVRQSDVSLCQLIRQYKVYSNRESPYEKPGCIRSFTPSASC